MLSQANGSSVMFGKLINYRCKPYWARKDSNLRPMDYESSIPVISPLLAAS